MDSQQNNGSSHPQWLNPQQTPFAPTPPSYYISCPQYGSYGTYAPYTPPIPVQYGSCIYYPPGIQPAMPVTITTVPAVQPIIQMSPGPQVPKVTTVQHAVQPGVTESTTKLPPLQVPLPSLANSPPSASNNNKSETEKLSHKKENGVYRCNKCERTYLSYPALYTHNKLKHPSNQPNPTTKSTNRGRPKKNVTLLLY